MKQLTLLFSLFFLSIPSYAQELKNDLYYYKGEQIPLDINTNAMLVNSVSTINLNTIFSQYGYTIDTLYNGVDNDEQDSAQYWWVVNINNANLNITQYNELVNNLRSNDGVGIEPVVSDEPGIPVSPYFYVFLKNAEDTTTLDSLAVATGAVILGAVPYMPLWYKLKANAASIGNSLQLSNLFYETGLFENIDPGFAFDFRPEACSGINDPDYQYQWGLENSTNNTLDINACQAWGLSKGDPDIRVAVIDEGINYQHTELDANMYPLHRDALLGTTYDLTTNPTLPYYGNHGTQTSSIIGAEQNNQGIIGVSPLTTLMSIAHDMKFHVTGCSQQMASAISWAVNNGAHIISNSWGDDNQLPSYLPLHSAVLENSIDNAIKNGRNGLGCLVVWAAGNVGHISGKKHVAYPANSIPEILTVGNMDQSGQRYYQSCYGSNLDIVAPGTGIYVATGGGGPSSLITTNAIGTSYATPHASGVAALMLAVNPCLTEEEIRLIIESTAQKVGGYSYASVWQRPMGTWNYEMGHGLLDAYAAVSKAQQMHSSSKDLYIKDAPLDFGMEPNTNSKIWISDDIWVRNQPDKIRIHQSPFYNASNPKVYVHVMVRNRGCSPSNSGELALYWAKSSTGVAWQNPWTNPPGQNAPGPDLGGIVGAINLPTIAPGHDSIFIFEWNVPNPADYPVVPGFDRRHFCFLARIYDPIYDPFHIAETSNINTNIQNNNNIAQKNVSILKFVPIAEEGSPLDDNAIVGIGNFLTTNSIDIDLEFAVPEEELTSALTDEAEVRIYLDADTWQKWQNGGAKGTGFAVIDETEHILQATGAYMRLDSLHYDTSQQSLLAVKINFLTEESTEKTVFNYDLIQKRHEDNEIMGGERFIAYKPEREDEEMFLAGGSSATLQQQVTLQAQSIGEPARYNWYKAADSTLVDTGTCITVTPTQNTTYLLEVIAKSDGFKDYADPVNAIAPPQSYITGLSPNPATGQVTLSYHLGQNVQIAQATITAINNPNTLATYNLNINQTQANLNLGTLPTGIYVVNLYCDSAITDSEQLIIQ